MIPSARTPWFVDRFAGHVRGRIHGRFSRVLTTGLAAARALVEQEPLVVVSNHSSWWDPMVALYVCHDLWDNDAHALMDAKNLVRLPFFQRIGAFGVDMDDRADGARAIRYGASLLTAKGRTVWVFPQGRERPLDVRPLGFREGAAAMARVAGVRTLPVAIHYAFGGVEAPEIRVAFGPPLAVDRDVARACAAQEDAVTALLAMIHDRRVRDECGGEGGAPFESQWEAKASSEFASWTLGRMFPLVDRSKA